MSKQNSAPYNGEKDSSVSEPIVSLDAFVRDHSQKINQQKSAQSPQSATKRSSQEAFYDQTILANTPNRRRRNTAAGQVVVPDSTLRPSNETKQHAYSNLEVPVMHDATTDDSISVSELASLINPDVKKSRPKQPKPAPQHKSSVSAAAEQRRKLKVAATGLFSEQAQNQVQAHDEPHLTFDLDYFTNNSNKVRKAGSSTVELNITDEEIAQWNADNPDEPPLTREKLKDMHLKMLLKQREELHRQKQLQVEPEVEPVKEGFLPIKKPVIGKKDKEESKAPSSDFAFPTTVEVVDELANLSENYLQAQSIPNKEQLAFALDIPYDADNFDDRVQSIMCDLDIPDLALWHQETQEAVEEEPAVEAEAVEPVVDPVQQELQRKQQEFTRELSAQFRNNSPINVTTAQATTDSPAGSFVSLSQAIDEYKNLADTMEESEVTQIASQEERLSSETKALIKKPNLGSRNKNKNAQVQKVDSNFLSSLNSNYKPSETPEVQTTNSEQTPIAKKLRKTRQTTTAPAENSETPTVTITTDGNNATVNLDTNALPFAQGTQAQAAEGHEEYSYTPDYAGTNKTIFVDPHELSKQKTQEEAVQADDLELDDIAKFVTEHQNQADGVLHYHGHIISADTITQARRDERAHRIYFERRFKQHKTWFLAQQIINLNSLVNPVLAVLLGSILATFQTELNFSVLLSLLLTVVLVQIFSNICQQYSREELESMYECKLVNRQFITRRSLRNIAAIVLACACAAGSTLIYFADLSLGTTLVFAGLGLLTVTILMRYSVGHKPYSFTIIGEFAYLFVYGILMVGAAFYLQVHNFSELLLYPAVACGLCAVSTLNLINMRDSYVSAAYEKENFATFLGIKASRLIQTSLYLFALVLYTYFNYIKLQPVYTYIFWCTAPLIVYHLVVIHREVDTNKLHNQKYITLVINTLMSGTFALGTYISINNLPSFFGGY